jgi:hypothetical protein
MQTPAQARAYERRRQAKVHARWNDNIRERERTDWRIRYPDDCFGKPWNLQDDDAEAFGYMRGYSIGGVTPIRKVEWHDRRTIWDEIHVLAYAFPMNRGE